jgi:RHS repeat-associated protein
MTVFGEDRGPVGQWPGERGFVNGTIDTTTGLTQVGARSYDAALGRFISVDPLMNLSDAQTLNGYAYANNSPATYWDGTGLSYCTPSDGICMEVGGNTTVSYKKKNGQSGIQTWNYKKGTGWRKISYTKYRPTSGGNYQTNRYSMTSGGWSGWTTVKKPAPVVRVQDYTLSSNEIALNDASQRSQNSFKDWASGAWDGFSDFWGKNGAWISGAAAIACIAISAGACVGVGLAVAGIGYAVQGSKTGWFSKEAVSGLVFDVSLTALGGGAALGIAGRKVGQSAWGMLKQKPWSRNWPNRTPGRGDEPHFRHAARVPLNLRETGRNLLGNSASSLAAIGVSQRTWW